MPHLELEKKLWSEGYKYVAGIDEAGRGPWAGPVTVGAVVIEETLGTFGIVDDSKKMKADAREAMFEFITATSLAYGVGVVSSKEIDEIGIQTAVQLATTRALGQVEEMIAAKVDYLIIDGKNVKDIEGYKLYKTNKGDAMHYSIAAASILAKVTRDRLMVEYAETFPQYGFEKHVGYGTKQHQLALETHGPCEIHRFTYKPIAKLAANGF